MSAILFAVAPACGSRCFLENFVLAFCFVALVHRWALVLLQGSPRSDCYTLLVLLNGGFGWMLLWTEMKRSDTGLLGALKALPPSVTVIPDTTWRWGNAVSTLLVPQRGMLLGLALAVIVFTQWWLSEEKGKREKGWGKARKAQKKMRQQQAKPQSQIPYFLYLFPGRNRAWSPPA